MKEDFVRHKMIFEPYCVSIISKELLSKVKGGLIMDREKTNSVTKLVKIIAEEVNEPRFKRLEERIKELEESIDHLNKGMTLRSMLETVKSSLENRGDMWNQLEDQMLVNEVQMAIATIAKNHKRTDLAIKMRIKDKGLL